MRLMLIDGDTSACNALSRMLRFHAVDITKSVEDALALMRDGRRIDAVILNVRMTGMDVPGFHAALAETRPDLAARVIYVTDGALRDHESQHPRFALLQRSTRHGQVHDRRPGFRQR
jgi:DNA-binding NtrC family response regulator